MITFKQYLLLTSLYAPVYLHSSDEQTTLTKQIENMNKEIEGYNKRLAAAKEKTKEVRPLIADLKQQVENGKIHWQTGDNLLNNMITPEQGKNLKLEDKLEEEYAQLVKEQLNLKTKLDTFIKNNQKTT
jgi:chromosome segregation ATPase